MRFRFVDLYRACLSDHFHYLVRLKGRYKIAESNCRQCYKRIVHRHRIWPSFKIREKTRGQKYQQYRCRNQMQHNLGNHTKVMRCICFVLGDFKGFVPIIGAHKLKKKRRKNLIFNFIFINDIHKCMLVYSFAKKFAQIRI